jgi:hypothetical protein
VLGIEKRGAGVRRDGRGLGDAGMKAGPHAAAEREGSLLDEIATSTHGLDSIGLMICVEFATVL